MSAPKTSTRSLARTVFGPDPLKAHRLKAGGLEPGTWALKYEREIDGLELLRSGFNDFHRLIDDIARHFGYEPASLNIQIGMNQLGELTPFRKRTIAFLYETTVIKQPSSGFQMNITGVNFRQLDTGQLSIQKMVLSDSKREQLKAQYGNSG